MRSFIESFIDVGSGFILAILIQVYIFPFFNLYRKRCISSSEDCRSMFWSMRMANPLSWKGRPSRRTRCADFQSGGCTPFRLQTLLGACCSQVCLETLSGRRAIPVLRYLFHQEGCIHCRRR